MATQFIVSDQTEPYWNIAVENYLVEAADAVVLYLWRNRRTVVIGQNQNPYSEVNVEALEADGGYLMRRKTGGGAVYHDDGNLNFSFVVPKALYDQRRQFSVIQRAVESFGLHTELSGRNDILAEGRKFSGNAFSKGRVNDLHHGTLLINGDMTDLARYLKPKPAKLQKHGVQSVRSRVVNLAELNPDITAESIVPRLRAAFEAEYGGNLSGERRVESGEWRVENGEWRVESGEWRVENGEWRVENGEWRVESGEWRVESGEWRVESGEWRTFNDLMALPEIKRLHDHFASAEWKYGNWQSFTAQRTAQFDWGGVEVSLDIKDGIIRDVQLASDALDLAALDEARRLLTGAEIKKRPQTESAIVGDILSLVY